MSVIGKEVAVRRIAPAGGAPAARASYRLLERRLAHARLWLLLLVGYGFLLGVCVRIAGESALGYWLSSGLAAAGGLVAIARSSVPPAVYGLTLRGAAASLRGALWDAALLVAGGAAVLWGFRALGWTAPGEPYLLLSVDAATLAYVLVGIPLQELLFRGVFQSSARFVFGEGRRASHLAVAFATVAYCAIHLPWGILAALLMAPPGIVWGLRFERDRTLVGVTVSHALVGWLFVCALPLWRILAVHG